QPPFPFATVRLYDRVPVAPGAMLRCRRPGHSRQPARHRASAPPSLRWLAELSLWLAGENHAATSLRPRPQAWPLPAWGIVSTARRGSHSLACGSAIHPAFLEDSSNCPDRTCAPCHKAAARAAVRNIRLFAISACLDI